MSEVDPNIARIAALRGKPVNYYIARQDKTPPIDRVPVDWFGRVFNGNPDWARDMRSFDRLPARSREFLRSSPLPLNAEWWDTLLTAANDDEEALISRVLAHVPGRMTDWIRQHYGAGHPSLRRV